MRHTGFFKTMENYSGSLLTAGMNAGRFDAKSLLRGQADMEGRIAGSGGDFNNLLSDTFALGKFGQQSDLGNMDAVKTQAALMNMDVEKYSEFMRNGNILDSKTAAYLNAKFGTDIFNEGQQFRFSTGEKGLTEMSISDNVKGRQLGSYDFDGTQQTVINDDGSVASSRFDGIFSTKDGRLFAGGITVDGDNAVIAASGSAGSELYDKLIDSKTTQLDDTFDVMQSILKGDKRAFERLNGLTGDDREAAYRQFAGSLANEAGAFLQKYEEEQWGTSAGVDVKIGANFDSDRAVLGKIASLTVGASVNAGVTGTAGLNRNDTSREQQNVIASEVYGILSNANGDTDVMAKDMQAYLKGLVGENLAGMPEVVENVSEALDKVKGLGFGGKGYVYRDKDGKIRNSQYIMRNGEWIKK